MQQVEHVFGRCHTWQRHSEQLYHVTWTTVNDTCFIDSYARQLRFGLTIHVLFTSIAVTCAAARALPRQQVLRPEPPLQVHGQEA
jgi:hypothetical protein